MDTGESNSERPQQKQKFRIMRRIVIAAILIPFVIIIWKIFIPHTTQTSQPVSLDQTKDCPIPLPPTARNIQFYRWNMLNLFCEFMKFEAPVKDCIGHIESVQAAWGKVFDDPSYKFEPVHSLEVPPMPQSLAQDRGIMWFDPQNIRKGITAGGGDSGVPMIWVDTEHGIFYYMLTD